MMTAGASLGISAGDPKLFLGSYPTLALLPCLKIGVATSYLSTWTNFMEQ